MAPDQSRSDSFGVVGGSPPIRSAEVILPCSESIEPTLEFFIDQLGFRLELIAPADSPRTAVISGHGLRLRLERGAAGGPGALRITTSDPASVGALKAPNGTAIELVLDGATSPLPPLVPSFVVTRASCSAWSVGRAGMRYRDLIPDRHGGRFIASHICIAEAGEVPDYVHYHRVRFQMIFCARGWVRVVYEDQGPPFVLAAGDCVLQPPEIRHRVLECSDGLEVFEISSPAEHETFAEHDIALPTSALAPDRDFGGQRFVHRRASESAWVPWVQGFERRDTGIADATGGLARVHVAQRSAAADPEDIDLGHGGELYLGIILRGTAELDSDARGRDSLLAGDAFSLPAGERAALRACSTDFEMLTVVFPRKHLAPPAQAICLRAPQ